MESSSSSTRESRTDPPFERTFCVIRGVVSIKGNFTKCEDKCSRDERVVLVRVIDSVPRILRSTSVMEYLAFIKYRAKVNDIIGDGSTYIRARHHLDILIVTNSNYYHDYRTLRYYGFEWITGKGERSVSLRACVLKLARNCSKRAIRKRSETAAQRTNYPYREFSG